MIPSMNVPVIANELVAAVRRISPASRITASASTVHKDQVMVLLDYHDAMKVIEFIEEHTDRPAADPRQGTLFDVI